jgi:hypothetical protein
MKKNKFKILSIFVGLLCIYLLFVNSPHYIKTQNWKYADGEHIGDWLEKDCFEVDNNFIISNNGKLKIVFCFGFKLIAKDPITGLKGTYINKS